jgi:hypothetical protein
MTRLTQQKPLLIIRRERYHKHNNSYNPAMKKQTLSIQRFEDFKILRLSNWFNLPILEFCNLAIDVGKEGLFTSGTGLQLDYKSCQNKTIPRLQTTESLRASAKQSPVRGLPRLRLAMTPCIIFQSLN